MKSIRTFLILSVALFAAATVVRAQSAEEQQVKQMRELFEASRTAYENADYRAAIAKATELEALIGTKTNVRTAYIKIMSYFRLKDYENCISLAELYLADAPAQDDTLAELQKALADAKRTLADQETERKQQEANREAERQRIAAAAKAKADHEREAAEKWERLKTSTNVTDLATFVQQYGDTPLKPVAQARYEDEKAWSDSEKANTIQATENYLKGKTLLNHSDDARRTLKYNYVRLCKEYAAGGNLSDMEDMYSRYDRMFSDKKDLAEMDKAKCDAYWKRATDVAKDRKSTTQMQSAINYYEKTRNCSGYAAAGKINSLKRKIKDINRKNITIVGYAGDTQTPYGITIGELSQRSVGVYFAARMNWELVDYGSSVKELSLLPEGFFEDESNKGDSFVKSEGVLEEIYTPEWPPKKASGNAVFGLNLRIVYPLWIYAGGGAAYDRTVFNAKYEAYKIDKGSRDFLKEETRKYKTDISSWTAIGDFGVRLAFTNAVCISLGVRTDFKPKGTYFAFGLSGCIGN